MFEQAFKNIDDVLWKDAGCTSELDYTEQTSWLLFLKYLDALEHDKATEAALYGRKYTHILDKPFRWETWAASRSTSSRQADGKVSLSNERSLSLSKGIDHNTALTGDDLIVFVNGKLFPYLHGFKAKATGPNTIEYKIGEIFGELKNKITSGYNLREIIEQVDQLRFRSQAETHELSALYEEKIKRMGNAGRNGDALEFQHGGRSPARRQRGPWAGGSRNARRKAECLRSTAPHGFAPGGFVLLLLWGSVSVGR